MKIQIDKIRQFANMCYISTSFGTQIDPAKFYRLLHHEAISMGARPGFKISLNRADNCFELIYEN